MTNRAPIDPKDAARTQSAIEYLCERYGVQSVEPTAPPKSDAGPQPEASSIVATLELFCDVLGVEDFRQPVSGVPGCPRSDSSTAPAGQPTDGTVRGPCVAPAATGDDPLGPAQG